MTSPAGVGHSSETYGASWGDLDGDGYPDLFVSNHWNQPSLFLNRGAEDGFLDVTRQTFQWTWTPNADTHGASWFDFDNDGDQDLFVTTGIGNPDQFLVNENGALVNRTRELGVAFNPWGGRLPVWMDFDDDGLPDFAMMMIGQPVQVMRQVRGGFEAITDAVGISCTRQQYGQFIDLTGDGRLEFICPDDADTLFYPQHIYDTLAQPWTEIPIADKFPSTIAGPDAVIADFNNDGHMDIFHISGMQIRPSGADINPQGTRLEARLMGDGKAVSFRSSGPIDVDFDANVFHEDFDNELGSNWIRIGADGNTPNGDPDTIVKSIRLDPSDPAVQGLIPADSREPPLIRIGYEDNRWVIALSSKSDSGESVFTDAYFEVSGSGLSDVELVEFWSDDFAARPTLLLFDPDNGRFVDATPDALLADIECVSAAAADFNNDTRVDLYLACRTGVRNIENILFENTGNGDFVPVANAGGAIGPLGLAVSDSAGTADSVVVADYDVDGRVDMFVTNGFNMFPKGGGGPNMLFRNVTDNENRWIQIDLQGTATHREAAGTVVTATTADVAQKRVRNGGYHRWSQDHNRLHFGLGQAESVDITVEWPSGTVDRYENVQPNRVYLAVENGDMQPVAIGDAAPYACGLPSEFSEGLSATELNERLAPGIYISRNCRIDLEGLDDRFGVQPGAWNIRATKGAGDTMVYTGRIESSAAISAQERANLNEDHDTVEVSENAIDFRFEVRGGQDGVDFSPEFGQNTCISVDVPEGAQIFYGPLKRPISINEFYLDTVASCPEGVPDAPPPPADPGDGSGNGDGGGDGDGDGDSNGDDGGSAIGDSGGGGGTLNLAALLALLAGAAARRRMTGAAAPPAGRP
ncbi:MAG: CRTAC1 family protein [Gammaproteobacteria bacterium]|nr:CRTAC1 family protein [Gammaproteobacteria bacterium]